MADMSLDIKHMPSGIGGYHKLLVAVCEISNYVVAVPLIDEESSTIFEAVFYRITCVFGNPKTLIVDEAATLDSHFMRAMHKALGI